MTIPVYDSQTFSEMYNRHMAVKDERIKHLENQLADAQTQTTVDEMKRILELKAEVKKWKLICCDWTDVNTEVEEESRKLRVAMDFLLRSPAGLVPSEADEFYDGERATFQEN